MSDERRRKQTERMVQEAVAKSHRKPWWKSVPSVTVAIISIAAAYIAFYPRPVITPGERSQANPLDMVVTLANNNVIPLQNVTVWLKCNDVETSGGDQIRDTQISTAFWTARKLGADDRQDLNLADGLLVSLLSVITYADVIVRVQYQPWFIPWTRFKNFRFQTQPQSGGSLRLMAVPEN